MRCEKNAAKNSHRNNWFFGKQQTKNGKRSLKTTGNRVLGPLITKLKTFIPHWPGLVSTGNRKPKTANGLLNGKRLKKARDIRGDFPGLRLLCLAAGYSGIILLFLFVLGIFGGFPGDGRRFLFGFLGATQSGKHAGSHRGLQFLTPARDFFGTGPRGFLMGARVLGGYQNLLMAFGLVSLLETLCTEATLSWGLFLANLGRLS